MAHMCRGMHREVRTYRLPEIDRNMGLMKFELSHDQIVEERWNPSLWLVIRVWKDNW